MSRNQDVEDQIEAPVYQTLSGFQSLASSCSKSSSLARPFWSHFSCTSSGTCNLPLGFSLAQSTQPAQFCTLGQLLVVAVRPWCVRRSNLGRSTWLSRGRGWTWVLCTWSGSSGTRTRGALLNFLSLFHFFCHQVKLSLHLGICLHGWEVFKFRYSTCRKISKNTWHNISENHLQTKSMIPGLLQRVDLRVRVWVWLLTPLTLGHWWRRGLNNLWCTFRNFGAPLPIFDWGLRLLAGFPTHFGRGCRLCSCCSHRGRRSCLR